MDRPWLPYGLCFSSVSLVLWRSDASLVILLQGFEILFFPFKLPLRTGFNQTFSFQRTSQLVLGGKAVKISAGACVDPAIYREIQSNAALF